ncbi:RDD family protein [Nocardioides panacis]|uniref:RDD family protein n=1 Tax=Nocardioides panacis TaxID=2849501 RepID=A0A975T280_9ACTN|nr:RDD family protein [Nocardioides panacis]QWZ09660.1 RDD family protein [Nocardioides panacis]
MVTRVVANVVDAGVVVALLVAAYAAVNGLVFVLNPRGFQVIEVGALLSVTSALVTYVLYATVAWSTVGRTYGCHVMGLRVVTRRGRRLHFLTAFVRAVFCAVLPIGLLWCAVSRTQRSVQDLVLRTAVIYDWIPRTEAAGSGP